MCSRTFFAMSVATVLGSILLALSLFPASLALAQTEETADESNSRMMCLPFFEEGALSAEVMLGSDATASLGSTTDGTVIVSYTGEEALYGMNVYVAVSASKVEGQVLNGPLYFATVAEGVTLMSNFTESYNFTWDVPKNLSIGVYEVAVYVSQHDTETMHGLAAYGREPLQTETLTLSGTPESYLTVAGGLTIDGESVDTTSYYLLSDTRPLTAAITATNESDDTPVMGTITLELFEGLTANPHKLVTQMTDEVRLTPGKSRTAELQLQHTIAELLQVHDIGSNQQLTADGYVLRATVKVGGKSIETFSYPLVQSEAALVSLEPTLEYFQVNPEGGAAAACVSYVTKAFDGANPAETIEITVAVNEGETEVARNNATFTAGDYQRNGADEYGLSHGLYSGVAFEKLNPGEYTFTASLSTGIEADNPAVYPVPKDLKSVVSEMSFEYSCPEGLCGGDEEIEVSPTEAKNPSQNLAIGVLVSLIALIIIFSAVRAVANRKKEGEFNDTMDDLTDGSEDGLGEAEDHKDK